MKTISLKPARGRMQQRALAARALPEDEQAAFYYCHGLSKAEFTQAVADGAPEALRLALDVVAAEMWLCPGDEVQYARSLRAALRRACAAGALTGEQRRILFSIEHRYLRRLVLLAQHTAPGELQQRAARKLPEQLNLMEQSYGSRPVVQIEMDEWPEVAAPEGLLRRAVRRGWFSPALAEALMKGSRDLTGDFLHAPEAVLPSAHKSDSLPDVPADTLCYYYGREGVGQSPWCVAPWGLLKGMCGLVLAADGAFYINQDEWGGIYMAQA